jgi:hypothetical protein
MVRVGLVVLGHVALVLSGIRRGPGPGLVRIKAPADSVIFSSVFLRGHFSVDLVHGLDDHTNVVGFGQGLEGRSGRRNVASKHDSRAGTVDVVGRVADGTNTGQIS